MAVASLAPGQAPDKPRPRILDVHPKHYSKDPAVKLDYGIVYVRAPRFVKGPDGKERHAPVWPEIGHPFNLRASTDLMVLHPDGNEHVSRGARARSPTLTSPSMLSGCTSILIGMHDNYSGLDGKSFQVVADFPVDGTPAGNNLASQFKAVNPGVWELKLNRPITELSRGILSVSVQDLQGNVTRVERTFSAK